MQNLGREGKGGEGETGGGYTMLCKIEQLRKVAWALERLRLIEGLLGGIFLLIAPVHLPSCRILPREIKYS
jgi:hypothetical protein